MLETALTTTVGSVDIARIVFAEQSELIGTYPKLPLFNRIQSVLYPLSGLRKYDSEGHTHDKEWYGRVHIPTQAGQQIVETRWQRRESRATHQITGQVTLVMPNNDARYDTGKNRVATADKKAELSDWVVFVILNSSSIRLLKPCPIQGQHSPPFF